MKVKILNISQLDEAKKETLRTWFKRKGAKGKAKGWVDCNAPDGKGGYKACGRKEDLEVHHIIPVHKDPSKELDPNNLITLCGKTCHLMFGHLMDYKSWNPNVEEDSELYLSKIKMRPYHDKSN